MNSLGGCIPDFIALILGVGAGLFALFAGIWLSKRMPNDPHELAMMQSTAKTLFTLGETIQKEREIAEKKGPAAVAALREEYKIDAENFRNSLPKRYKKLGVGQ